MNLHFATPCRIAPLLAAALLGACGAPALQPTAGDDQVPSAGLPAPASAFEQRLRERALSQARQGRLAEAATSWEILTALRPGAREYRERLADTREQIDAAVPERLRRAQHALKRGELDAATAQLLAVLALQPDHEQAADALRTIERERNRQNFLGKYSRAVMERRASGAPPATVIKSRVLPREADN